MNRTQGFTLLELSVVLIIIGLIIGGVIEVSNLKRNAQMRNALAEYDTYLKAIGEFRDKYQALPGDMNNAESIWGTDTAGCPGGSATPKTTTCNGDGNGHIGNSSTAGVLSNTQEWFRTWQQLADAGLIKGEYSGSPGPGGANEATIGVNVPVSALRGAGWTLNYYLLTSNSSNHDLWPDQYGHLLHLGGPVASDYTKGPMLTGAEALSMDQKIDDGLPGMGKMRAWRNTVVPVATCITGDGDGNQATATYNNSNTNICSLIFILGF